MAKERERNRLKRANLGSAPRSVAFRVSEDEWRRLQDFAQKEGITVAKLARAIVFERLDLGEETPSSKKE